MKLMNSLYMAGVTGVGKSYGFGKLVTDLGYKAVIIDFENKFKKNIKESFIDFNDQFEWYLGYVKRKDSDTNFSLTKSNKLINSSTDKMGIKFTPDWEKTYNYLTDLINGLIDRTDYDVLIFDGADPILRNKVGLAQWRLNNPGRDNPDSKEWGPMNDIEEMFIRGGIAWAEEYDKLFILTGQMKDEYKGDKKVGKIPCMSDNMQHPIDVTLQIEKHVGVKTNYVCTCMDSIKGQWVENLTMDRHVSDILIEKGLIGND